MIKKHNIKANAAQANKVALLCPVSKGDELHKPVLVNPIVADTGRDGGRGGQQERNACGV